MGGHCIAVGPYFLIERFGDDASLIKASCEVNDHKPICFAKKVIHMIEGDISKVIDILGLSYKADCEDCRESSGITICKYLQNQGFRILANEVNSSQTIISDIPNTDGNEVLQNNNIVIIAQKHTAYQNLDFCQKQVIDRVDLSGTSV